jgi:hypothetical protein
MASENAGCVGVSVAESGSPIQIAASPVLNLRRGEVMMAATTGAPECCMEGGLFLLGLLIVLFTLYRVVSRKLATPQATVRMLLRRYHAFERLGLREQDCLYRILTARKGWRNLPPAFIADLIARLKTKENVFRFITLAEEHRFNRKELPAIARNPDREKAMREIAMWLGEFGARLQAENRLKEAEFVQRLALGLQPDQYSPSSHWRLLTTRWNVIPRLPVV